MRSDRGIAIVVVLLVTAVALMAVVGATSLAAVTSRQTASSERRSTTAFFAAESGLNSIVAKSKTSKYRFESVDPSVEEWLERVNLDSYTLPGEVQVNLSVLGETPTRATLRSEGIAPDGSRRVLIQDYELGSDGIVPGLYANAAVVTQGTILSNSAQSTIKGRDSDPDAWVFPNRRIGEALEGEYFRMPHECDGGDEVTFRVGHPAADDTVEVQAFPDGACPDVTSLPSGAEGTLVPFAVADAKDTIGRDVGLPDRQTIAVTDTSLYAPGNTVFIGTGEAEILGVGAGTLEIQWTRTPSSRPIPEATPIRLHVPSLIAEGAHGNTACPSEPGTSSKFPQGCYINDLSNIWEKTFPGISKGKMLDAAVANGSHYGPGSETAGDWPEEFLSGVTWIDGAQTGNFNGGGNGNGRGNSGGESSGGGLCGEGVVILNTGVYGTDASNQSINLNVSDCEFKGVLYVIGELGIQGNLDSFSGTIIVETDQGTRIQGNGEKSFYDPVSIRRALVDLPPPTGTPGIMGAIPTSWRFGE